MLTKNCIFVSSVARIFFNIFGETYSEPSNRWRGSVKKLQRKKCLSKKIKYSKSRSADFPNGFYEAKVFTQPSATIIYPSPLIQFYLISIRGACLVSGACYYIFFAFAILKICRPTNNKQQKFRIFFFATNNLEKLRKKTQEKLSEKNTLLNCLKSMTKRERLKKEKSRFLFERCCAYWIKLPTISRALALKKKSVYIYEQICVLNVHPSRIVCSWGGNVTIHSRMKHMFFIFTQTHTNRIIIESDVKSNACVTAAWMLLLLRRTLAVRIWQKYANVSVRYTQWAERERIDRFLCANNNL